MYDYIELRSDHSYSKSVPIEKFDSLMARSPGIKHLSGTSYAWTVGEYAVRIQGIACDRTGNYAIHDDSKFKAINLVEINLPSGSESEYENKIRELAEMLSQQLDWEIDWRE